MFNVFKKKLLQSRFFSRLIFSFPFVDFSFQFFKCLFSRIEREKYRVIKADFLKAKPLFNAISRSAPSPTKTLLVVSSLGSVEAYKSEGLLALALKKKGYKIVVLHPFWAFWRSKYHKLLGFSHHKYFKQYLKPGKEEDKEKILQFFALPLSVERLMYFDILGVDIGRIALSNWLYANKFSKLDLGNPQTIRGLEKECLVILDNIESSNDLIKDIKPDMVLLREKGLSPSAEIFGVCVSKNIPVIQFVHSQHMDDLVFKRYNFQNRHQHPFALDNKTWEVVKNLPWQDDIEEKLLKSLENEYKEGTWFRRKFLHNRKKIKTPQEVREQLRLDPKKKNVVVFSHVLWDATFFYGDSLFKDYETWLVETVKFASGYDKVNWIIKLHPDLVWKLKYENHFGPLRDMEVLKATLGSIPEHIRLVFPETDIDTFSFFEITDVCLTVRGTIGIEMACRGIPVITAGTGRYSGLGFTIDSKTKEEYFEKLRRIDNIPQMSKTETVLARRFAQALFELRLWKFRSFQMEKMSLENTGHPLDNNWIPSQDLETEEDFELAEDIQAFTNWALSYEVDYLDIPKKSVVHSTYDVNVSF